MNKKRAKERWRKEKKLQLTLSEPVQKGTSCFCAALVYRIVDKKIELAYIPYRHNGVGREVIKLAGGMNHEHDNESPTQTVSREIQEELGLDIKEENFHFYFSISTSKDHTKLFFVVPEEIKTQLSNNEFDKETGIPQWCEIEWFKQNVFSGHEQALLNGIDFLLSHFLEQKNVKGLLAAVNSGLLEPSNKVKGLLLQRAQKDMEFALANSEELKKIGVGL